MNAGDGLARAFEYGREAMIVIDNDGRIVAANHFTRLGYSLHALAFVVSMDLALFRRELLASGCARHELHVLDADGTAHEVIAHGVTLEGGRHLITFEDVGELRQIERTLRQAQRLDSRSQFTATAVNELKTLTTELLLHGALLEARISKSATDETLELTSELLAASRRAAVLVECMRGFLTRDPAEAAQPSGGSSISQSRRRAVTRGDETILVLTRDAAVGAAIRVTLEEAGYAVLDASSPAAALAFAEHHGERIDLLLCEAGAELAVAEFVERARSFHPDLKTLECESCAAPELLRAVREALGEPAEPRFASASSKN